MRNARRFLLLSPLVVLASFAVAGNRDLPVFDHYVNKTRVLRGFYSGEHLRYDSSGSLVSGNPSGDWTSDGFLLITDIGIEGHELRIRARRVSVVSPNKTFILRVAENEVVRPNMDKAIVAEIAVDMGTESPSPDQVDAALAKIFLSDK